MKKLLLMPVLVLAGIIIAGLYGVLHNQISYTVSPEYFTRFKFAQFSVPEHMHSRIGASIVGWRATWWMGAIIGAVIVPVGLIIRGVKNYAMSVCRAFLVVVLTAITVGLTALLVSCFTIHGSTVPDYWYPGGLVDTVAFARVGTMHNFSYLGGLLGMPTGIVYLILRRKSDDSLTSAREGRQPILRATLIPHRGRAAGSRPGS